MTLFKQYFRVQRTGLFIWAGGNAVLAWTFAATVKPMETGDMLGGFISKFVAGLPPGLQALFGLAPGLSPIDTLVHAKMGFWMVIAVPIYACLLAASAVSREIDRGTADFLLALPVGRKQVLVARWGVMAVALAVLSGVTWGALCAGLAVSGVRASFAGYFWMMFQIWFLGLAVGSLAMLGSMWLADYESSVKWSLGAVGVLFVVDFGMRIAEFPKVARFLNPFTYYDTLQPLMQKRLMWGDAMVLLGISLASLWLAARVFDSRQIQA